MLFLVIICGCSLVVKPQPSKLMSWVRFPSPAPYILFITQCFVSQIKRSIAFFMYEIIIKTCSFQEQVLRKDG